MSSSLYHYCFIFIIIFISLKNNAILLTHTMLISTLTIILLAVNTLSLTLSLLYVGYSIFLDFTSIYLNDRIVLYVNTVYTTSSTLLLASMREKGVWLASCLWFIPWKNSSSSQRVALKTYLLIFTPQMISVILFFQPY